MDIAAGVAAEAHAPTLTVERGLSAAEVAERVRDGRTNDLPDHSGRSVGDIVRANVMTRINVILAVLFLFVLSTGSLINGAFGLLIIFNSGIGIIQELRAKRTLDNFAVIGEAKPTVRRDGVSVTLTRTEVVADDIIEIGPGDQLIVDGEMVEAQSLEIDESLLTGEADPMAKTVGSAVMSGSFVVAGSGAYRATKVGREAYAARLVAEASKFTLVGSELRSGIDKILGVVSWLLVPVGLLTIFTQMFRIGSGWREGVLGMVAALVPMVPEGLVLLTSIAFAVGVIRLGRRQCLVQELPAIEGLARVDVVCADKTGTLTENGMRLAEIRELTACDPPAATVLAHLAATEPHPNASLQAIVEGIAPVSAPWGETHHAPFTSARKWSGSTFADQGTWVLGAPDVLAAEGTPARVTAEEIGGTGLRVLLLGRGTVAVTEGTAPGEVTAVWRCLDRLGEEDVAVKVISGDNARSVGAVTSGLGLVGGSDALDARILAADPYVDAGGAPTEQFTEAVARHTVFGRVTPDQKRSMVDALKARGHTVAMTGDGVNDVLALKQADIGVSMGSGSPATRAVAQIVLLDNRFATLPHVVAEGRRVIGNIERVANLFLTKTVYSVLLALVVGLWQLPFPLQPIHVTITGWFTIGVPAFLLSLAPNHERAQPGFARRVLTLAVPSGVIVAVATFTSYLMARATALPGVSGQAAVPEDIRTRIATATLATLIVAATWVLAVVARPYEWWKVGLIALSAAAYLLIFSWPAIARLVLLDASDAAMMTRAVLIGVVAAVFVEIGWWVQQRRSANPRRFWATGD